MDLDELVEKMDAEGVVQALIKSGVGIKYKGATALPLIQVLPGGTWFVQKRAGRGLDKDVTETLLAALKVKKK